jgi:hypothetical protein
MRVHIFKAQGNQYGFSCDPLGANLPADRGAWSAFKAIEIFEDHPAPRIGVNEADILMGIQNQGFYLTDRWTDE